jgi:hypothetical protein
VSCAVEGGAGDQPESPRRDGEEGMGQGGGSRFRDICDAKGKQSGLAKCHFQSWGLENISASTLLSFGHLFWEKPAAITGGCLGRSAHGARLRPPANNQH